MGTRQTALVTGCAGLLGSHLSRHLIERGHNVVGIDDLSGGYREWVPDSPLMTFVEADLNDYDEVVEVFDRHRPAAAYHFAAYAAEGLSPFIRRFNYHNNIVASATVVNCCVTFDAKMIYTSSMAVYGDQEPPFREDMALTPVDPYGVAKAAVEQDIRIAGHQHELRWSIVRPHNVIGVQQNIWDRYRNVLGIFVRRALHGQPLTIFGDGSQLRAFSDVRDLLAPLEKLMATGDGQTYNVGSSTAVSVVSLARLVQQVASEQGIHVELEFLPARHEVKFAYSDHTLAERDLGFIDRTDLLATVREVFEWAALQPDREVKFMPYEITKDMYQAWA